MPTCARCGGGDIDVDAGRGNAVCTACGYVLEDRIIVNEVVFAETGHGAANVVGQFVSAEGIKSCTLGPGFHHGFGRESKEVTLANGRRRIAAVAAALRLNSHHVDAAQQYFKLAVQNKFIRGRKTVHVIAACLYIVCRTESTPHMLLDFSDVLQVNVYTLGSTFLKLCRLLNLSPPVIDPSLYIFRFAHKLEFGDKTHDVAMTALRLVARMKRDWMQVGRRPAGICGASLLIASRLYGFARTRREVVNVVRVGIFTLRTRLEEFADTPTGALTAQEFQTIDLEEECDPPSYTQARRRQRAGPPVLPGVKGGNETAELELRAMMEQDEFKQLDQDAAGGAPEGSGELAKAALAARPIAIREAVQVPEDLDLSNEDLSNDESDDEVSQMILSKDEEEAKERIWTDVNREYLEEMEARARRAAARDASGEPKRKRRRHAKERRTIEPAEDAREAIRQMLTQRKISQKINYSVLEESIGGLQAAAEDGAVVRWAPVLEPPSEVTPLAPRPDAKPLRGILKKAQGARAGGGGGTPETTGRRSVRLQFKSGT